MTTGRTGPGNQGRRATPFKIPAVDDGGDIRQSDDITLLTLHRKAETR